LLYSLTYRLDLRVKILIFGSQVFEFCMPLAERADLLGCNGRYALPLPDGQFKIN